MSNLEQKASEIMNDLEKISKKLDYLIAKAEAYDYIQSREQDALNYCRENKVDIRNCNVWHGILDNAIRMRNELK